MDRYFDNPFSDYGSIVYGDRFIGRQASLQVIENRLILPANPGNLAIIGDHKIGKSSLVHHAIIQRKEELTSRRSLPIWINLGTYNQPASFFRALVTNCCDELEDMGWMTEPIQRAAHRALNDELGWTEGYSRIQRFFQRIRQGKIRVMFILDEFDHARHLFRGNTFGFQGLRELSYRPEWRVTFVTTSRRTIRDIELQTQAISTFDGIFHKHYLAMFDDSDIQEYFGRMPLSDMLDINGKKRINYYCGGHPYLLETMGYELVESFREHRSIDVDQVAQRIQGSFLDQYDRMTDLLDEDGTLRKLLQIFFGPVVDVQQTDIDEFMRYGVIKKTRQGNYIAFSEHFQTYLKVISRHTELWPIWSEAELALRQLITTEMLEQYGEQWITKLERARPNLKRIFDSCRQARDRETKAFSGRASQNLVDFTNPADLFDIIFAEWKTFQKVLGRNKRDKNYWGQCQKILAKIRNPLAHNRDAMLHAYEKEIAAGYCKEIVTALRNSNNNR